MAQQNPNVIDPTVRSVRGRPKTLLRNGIIGFAIGIGVALAFGYGTAAVSPASTSAAR